MLAHKKIHQQPHHAKSVPEHKHAHAKMVVMTKEQFHDNPAAFAAFRKAGKQVGIKGDNGKVNIVVGTGGRTPHEKKEDHRALEKLYQEVGVTDLVSSK